MKTDTRVSNDEEQRQMEAEKDKVGCRDIWIAADSDTITKAKLPPKCNM